MLFKLTNAGDIDELIEYVELIKEKTIIEVYKKTEKNSFGRIESNLYIDIESIEDTMILSDLLGYRVIIGRSLFDDEPQLCIYDNYLE